jgi:hypothetical protein
MRKPVSIPNSKAVILSDFITKDELDEFLTVWETIQKDKDHHISFKNCFVQFVDQHPMLSQRCIDKGILPAFLGYSLEYIISKQPLRRE